MTWQYVQSDGEIHDAETEENSSPPKKKFRELETAPGVIMPVQFRKLLPVLGQ